MAQAQKSNIISGKVDAMEYIKSHNGYPEVGSFADQKSLQKFNKQLSDDTLKDWCAVEGLEYKENEHAAINRMRIAMAILYHHFPKQVATKQESPYKKYSTEDLVQMAMDNNVAFEVSEDDRILRMRAIMALRANKVIV